ncbi:MAG: alpha-amylase family glycosyl hydrolase [Daejeonella sp.]
MKQHYLMLFGLFLITSLSCKKQDPGEGTPIPETPESSGTETGLVTYLPALPIDNGQITLAFDAAKGNKDLQNTAGDVYIHTGVITDKSASASDWKYVIAAWTSNLPKALLTKSGAGNTYTLNIANIRSFYNVPVDEKILKLAMVFRNADGSKVGRNKDGSDIYIPVYETGKLAVRFTSPEFEPTYSPQPVININLVGEELNVTAVSSLSANLSLTLNGVSFAIANSTTKISGKAKITNPGPQQIKVIAIDGASTAEAVINFIINGKVQELPLPIGAKDGVTFINNGTSAIFTLYAPNKKSAYVIGDFNDWTPSALMNRTNGTWWVQIDNLNPNFEYAYQFLIDGSLRIADPYCEKILDPGNDPFLGGVYPALKPYPAGKTTGIVSTMYANQENYSWSIDNFNRPDKKDLVIYELHLRDFLAAHHYNTLKDTLDYLQNLGINAIELMPVNEFEGNSSWGYNPSFYFAADKYYGTKNDLKRFIDECHTRGIAVILDMVLNHSFGQSPMVQLYFDGSKPSAESPWFNADAKHPFNVGYDFNHESPATKYFVKNVLNFWMKEYKVDGFRFDLSKGFTQTNNPNNIAAWGAKDLSRIAIWNDYNNYIKSVDNNNFYVILEHFADDAEEKELSANGMMLWNNVNYNFTEASMGYIPTSDFSRAFYDKHGFTEPNLITYMESHDEERMMYKNLQYGNSSLGYNIKNLATALKRQEMAAAFFMAIPGPKMIWQFGELGYDIPINYKNDRTGEKPIHWEYTKDPSRHALYTLYSKMIKMKRNNAVFRTGSFSSSLAGPVKYIQLNGAGVDVMVIGNFDVTMQQASITFPSSGTWYDQLNNTSITINNNTYSQVLQPGEFYVNSNQPLDQ